MTQRFNEGTLEALSSPSRERVFIDFSQEVEVEPVSREIWIFGTGTVQWQLVGNEDFSDPWTVDNLSTGNIFITAKQVKRFGPQTTVSQIRVYD